MPPRTRRAGAGPTAAQSKLSFNNRITKSAETALTKSKSKSNLNEPAQQIITTEIAKQTTPEPEIQKSQSNGKGASTKQATVSDSPVRILPSPSRQKSKRRVRRSLNDDDDDISFEAAEKQANKISEGQVKKYWKAEEDSRLAPRAHQETLPIYEKILRHFDLSSEYGPCIGITRLQRWKRAQGLSLNPPIEVLAVLLKEDAKDTDTTSKANAEKRVTGRLAYVDELGGARDDML